MLAVWLGVVLVLLGGCGKVQPPLTVYAGKGLSFPMEEIKLQFEQREGVQVNILYAGSDTLLTTLRTTGKGDVFIPGAASYIKDAGGMVTSDQPVASHVPAFVARPGKLQTYADLLQPGVRIAVGNKDMAAVGRIAESILKHAPPEQSFRNNVVVSASTVNELLRLVKEGEVDAALVWADMLQWQEAEGLTAIAVPPAINQPKEIHVATLASSLTPVMARRFADFVATEGKVIFERYGFGKS